MNYSRVKSLHRVMAGLLAVFIISHLSVHAAVLISAESHLGALSIVQKAYRNLIVEFLLMLAIVIQICLGAYLVRKRWRMASKTFWAWLQIASGLYLAVFMLIHSSAALITHHIFDLETNFYWAATTVHIEPLKYFFMPYYFLGVTSVFAHFAATIHFSSNRRMTTVPMMVLIGGSIYAVIIIAGFAGGYYDVDIPQEYIDNFDKYMPF